MAKFSKIFGLGLDQPQLDFVDIDPDVDTPLFLDPYAISLKGDTWSETCDTRIVSFFETALDHIRAGRDDEAKRLLNGLTEPNDTCLGLSRGNPKGRGVSGKQANDLYHSLAKSQAAKTGLLSELAECDLFVEGIGPDKISDIATNIIRRLLIDYTQSQCHLHGISTVQQVASGRFWDIDRRHWREEYVDLPVIRGSRVILVPKYTVRLKMALNSQEYYTHFVLNFLQEQELSRGSSLVHVLKNGKRKVFKKDLREKFPFSKEFLAQFSELNPQVLERYKQFYVQLPGASGAPSENDLEENFDEPAFCRALIEQLADIPSGAADASRYHSLIAGTMEFLFWPSLIYPRKETPIHDARKRIDITYTNAATDGFFFRVHIAHQIASNILMIECKNYTSDPSNPEIDQISGRFSINRGKLGFLVYRKTEDYELLLKRCRDTASDGRGFVIPLGDDQVIEYLRQIEHGKRKEIDRELERVLSRLIT